MKDYVAKRVRPALNYFGGKVRLCHQILEIAPEHTIYVEPFAGGLSVLLNKYRSDVEVACDVSSELILFYRVLVDRCEEVIERVQDIKFDKPTFLAACAAGDRGDELTQAVNFLCRQRMSFSGRIGGWAEPKHKVAAWESLPACLRTVAKRLKGVKLFLRSGLDVIPEYDSSDTWFYIDPPYYMATRNGGEFLHEFNEMDHLRLLRSLNRLRGKVILSGYDYLMYNKELVGWDRVEIEMPTSSNFSPAKKRAQRTEVLWVK
jgi:DNA adenine methylase